MATSDVKVTPGSGKNVGTYSFTEDAETKDIGRVALNNSSGTEIGTSGSPVRTDPTGGTTQPVSGTVTANAGSNLNTSLLALESGGNLATVAGIVTSSRAAVNLISGQTGVAGGAGVTGATVQRMVLVNDQGKTLVSTGGSAASSGDNTIVSAGTNKLKIYAFSLTTVSTTAMTCIFKSGAGGTELWRVVIQAITGSSAGANLSIAPPAYLFATASATLLNLNLSSANAVHWSVSYFDEA